MSDSKPPLFDSVSALLQQGKAENFDALVLANAGALEGLRRLVERVQRVAPDVALSPYIMRALRILEQQRAIAENRANIPAAA